MFSGLVSGDAHVNKIEKTGHTIVLDVETTPKIAQKLKIGDSIAINGTCLTVEKNDGKIFEVTMMPQTYKKTIFKFAQPGDRLNIEPSLEIGQRLEGHIVTGHIDETVELVKRKENENAIELHFSLPERLKNQIVPQGSIAINGVSLTVMDTDENTFSVGLIPHTQDETNLSTLKEHDQVNIETDILGKYVAANVAKGE